MNQLFNKLEQSISSTIYEGLLKIGYNGKESFSIYYDLDLLNHLLNTEFKTNEDCFNYLEKFNEYMNEKSICLEIHLEKNRFKFTVNSEGIDTINTIYNNNQFLKELITLVKGHNFTLDDVLNVFKRYANDFVCEESINHEFQYVIYFKDSNIDPYRYCFSFDAMGGYYHRLLEYDYYKALEE